MEVSKLRCLAVAFAIVGVTACSSNEITAPDNSAFTLAPIPDNANYYLPVAGAVKVCSFLGPGQFTTSATPSGGGTTIETTTSLGVNECSITWLSNGAPGPYTVTVTQVGPTGFDLFRLYVQHTNRALDENHQDPAGCLGTLAIPSSENTTVGGAAGAAFWFKQCSPTPPPPPEGCFGLTPGFWKNWANHYTAAQFATLIDGTSFPSLTNAQAKSILSANNPALTRLRKFLLANQLTMSLSNQPGFPNPSGGALSGDCRVGGNLLSSTIITALDMLANPGDYTTQEILDLGTVLDTFANL